MSSVTEISLIINN